MVLIAIIILGLVFGSFAGAQVWRLRARQLVEDEQAGETLSIDEKKELRRLRPLLNTTVSKDRSRCLSCKHELDTKDLLPLVSWISTRGRCRYCKKPIGNFEPLIELGTALLFTVSYLLWPVPLSDVASVALFALWLVAGVLLVILFAYDMKWFLLPDKIVLPLAIIGGIFATVRLAEASDVQEALLSLVGAIVLLGGLYAALYYYSFIRSKGESTWVGFGDVKLGLVLALFLANWQLAFLALFLANFIGTLVVLPGLMLKLLPRRAHIPFGPLLIAGFLIAFFWGEFIVDWFLYNGNMLVLY